MINYGKHSVEQQDIDAVVDVLKNQFLTQGQQVPAFEKALCDYTGAQYCSVVNSGTSGLHVACMALGITKGDLVWTSPNSFAASANCALYCNADVDFIDIDAESRNICPVKLESKLMQAQANNRLPRAIVVVHFAGASCDMQAIHALCEPLNIAIIEDAAHGLGGTYLQKPIGSCEYSCIAVLSFHPVKSITTAEGGAVMTNDPIIAKRCQLFSKHGITREEALMQGENHGPWYYQQIELGYNYRLNDLQAALGISQLKRINDFIDARRRVAARYMEKLAHLPLILPSTKQLDESSWHLFMVELSEHERKDVFNALHERGIGVNVHYIPIHLHPYYQRLGFCAGDFPIAESFYEHALTLPIYPELSEAQQDQVVQALQAVLYKDVTKDKSKVLSEAK